jgi:nuclear GTP-binding protein
MLAKEAARDAEKAKMPIAGVTQVFSKIRVESKYLNDDLKNDEEEEDDAVESTVTANETEDKQGEKADDEQEAEENVDWDDVFENVVGETVDELPAEVNDKKRKRTEEDDDDEETESVQQEENNESEEASEDNNQEEPESDFDSEPDVKKPRKEKRVTTNKRKVGTHYYETSNVKNKNRTKQEKQRQAALNDPKRLEKKLRGDGKRRAA